MAGWAACAGALPEEHERFLGEVARAERAGRRYSAKAPYARRRSRSGGVTEGTSWKDLPEGPDRDFEVLGRADLPEGFSPPFHEPRIARWTTRLFDPRDFESSGPRGVDVVERSVGAPRPVIDWGSLESEATEAYRQSGDVCPIYPGWAESMIDAETRAASAFWNDAAEATWDVYASLGFSPMAFLDYSILLTWAWYFLQVNLDIVEWAAFSTLADSAVGGELSDRIATGGVHFIFNPLSESYYGSWVAPYIFIPLQGEDFTAYAGLFTDDDEDYNLFLIIDLAATILHELMHVINAPGQKSDEPDECSSSYLEENFFRWAALNRYPTARACLSDSRVRRLYGFDEIVYLWREC